MTMANGFEIRFVKPQTNGNAPEGKVAEAELHFTDGELAGLKLAGFTIWNGRNGGLRLTFPARSYVRQDGAKIHYPLLRDITRGDEREPYKRLAQTILREFGREPVAVTSQDGEGVDTHDDEQSVA
jgi:hypothetical protein